MVNNKVKKILSDAIKKILISDNRVIFAYLFGSCVKEDIFRDIDIAVYLYKENILDPFKVSVDLKQKISNEIKRIGKYKITPDHIDIAILNITSLSMQMEILKTGLLLKDIDYDLRTTFIEKVSNNFLDYSQLKEEASLCS